MKIGIYSKWLETLGGGEKVSTVMAEILSKRGYDVDLIATFKPDKRNIERKMSVDLSRVRIVPWQERSYDKLIRKTEEYDLFINTSFMDHQPSKAKKSLYYIHFPTSIRRTFLGLIKYETVLPILRKTLIIPIFSSGLRNIDDIFSRSGKWLDGKNTIILSNPPRKFRMKFRIYAQSLTARSLNTVKINSPNAQIKRIDRRIDHYTSTLFYEYQFEMKDDSSAIINISVQKDTQKAGVALVSMTVNNVRFFAWNFIKRYLPRYEMALYGSSTFKPAASIDTYDMFLANSQFTKKWTHRYWDKNALVLHPPVDVEKFKNSKKKRNYILNVGRFFLGGHSKRQDILVQAFKEMVDEKILPRDWELHLVGGIVSGWEHADYVKSLRKASKGYPIFFHFSPNFSELKDLYSKAKIYWHATGYGQNELRNPICFEHFGITVVEAMASGCVPVVFQGGGLTETVNRSSLTWKNLYRLKKITSSLVNNPSDWKEASNYAVKESKKYSRKNFEKRFLAIIRDLTKDEDKK